MVFIEFIGFIGLHPHAFRLMPHFFAMRHALCAMPYTHSVFPCPIYYSMKTYTVVVNTFSCPA